MYNFCIQNLLRRFKREDFTGNSLSMAYQQNGLFIMHYEYKLTYTMLILNNNLIIY